MHVADILAEREFSPQDKVRKEIYRSGAAKVLLICFESGQALEPCVMGAEVVFYVVEGTGRIRVESTTVDVRQGSLVVVPAGLERQIEACSPMVVLALQALGQGG